MPLPTSRVRQRKSIEELPAATQDQLPITAAVSINWTVVSSSTIEMFRQYGKSRPVSRTESSTRNCGRQPRQPCHGSPANKLIQERQTVVAEIMNTMTEELTEFPITVNFAAAREH